FCCRRLFPAPAPFPPSSSSGLTRGPAASECRRSGRTLPIDPRAPARPLCDRRQSCSLRPQGAAEAKPKEHDPMLKFLDLPPPIAPFFDGVGWVLFLFVGLFWLRPVFVSTPQQHARVLETFGRYSGYRSAGLTLKLPWPLQVARRPFSLQTKQIALQLGVKSRDNAFVTMPISLQYRVIPRLVKAAFYELQNPEDQIESYVATEARAVAAAKTFDQLYTDRDEFTQTVRESLEEAMNDYGYEIRAVLIDDPRPTEEMIAVFNEVLASQRRLEAAHNDG